jgi:hypothetical protein
MEGGRDVTFVVSQRPLVGLPSPVIGVDGPVRGADLCYDHHATGEPVNLLAIPEQVPWPGTIATTSLDGDAVISAAVVLLRASGEGKAIEPVWPVLHEACYHCDWLGASGRYPDAEMAGLGLHCWLKSKGFALGEVMAWAGGNVRRRPDKTSGETGGGAQPEIVLTDETRGAVFRHLTLAMVGAVRAGLLPSDREYLDRLPAMEQEARAAIERVEGSVTVLVPAGYLDPLAYYRVVDTDLVVVVGSGPEGAHRYTLGVHPRAYSRVDLRPILAALASREPGWGGRRNAGGSPMGEGSRFSLSELVSTLNALLAGGTTAPVG